MNLFWEKMQEYGQYRSLVRHLVVRDFKTRYMGSSLGSLWSVLNPLVMILIYTLIFSKIMGARMPGMTSGFSYSIYLCAGILPWMSFAETVARSTNVFLENSNLVNKVAFPKMVLLVYVNIIGIINFLISFLIFFVFLILIGHYPSQQFLLLPLVYGAQLLLTFGLGMAFSCLNVYFRDIAQLVGITLQILFWGTPIVYIANILSPRAVTILKINPMFHLIDAYHNIILYKSFPSWISFGAFAAFSLLVAVGGYLIFRKTVPDVADEI